MRCSCPASVGRKPKAARASKMNFYFFEKKTKHVRDVCFVVEAKPQRANMHFYFQEPFFLVHQQRIVRFNCCALFHFILSGRKRADATAEVAAEAEKRTATETGIETEIGTGTGRDATALDPDPGLAPETVRGKETEIETEREIEIVAKEETSLHVGASVHPAPKKTKTKTLTAGRTNMWTVLRQRSLL